MIKKINKNTIVSVTMREARVLSQYKWVPEQRLFGLVWRHAGVYWGGFSVDITKVDGHFIANGDVWEKPHVVIRLADRTDIRKYFDSPVDAERYAYNLTCVADYINLDDL